MMENLKMEIADDEIITLQQHDIKNNTFIYDNNSKQNRLSIKYEPEKLTVKYQARQWISNIDYKPLLNETTNKTLEGEEFIAQGITKQITPYITDPKMILMQDICKEISITDYEGKEITLNLKNIKKNPDEYGNQKQENVDTYKLEYTDAHNTSYNLKIEYDQLSIKSILMECNSYDTTANVTAMFSNISNIQFGSFIHIPDFNDHIRNKRIEPMKGQINLNNDVLLDCLSYLLCSNQTISIYELFSDVRLNMVLKDNNSSSDVDDGLEGKYVCNNMQVTAIGENCNNYVFTYKYNVEIKGDTKKDNEESNKQAQNNSEILPSQIALTVELDNNNITQFKLQVLDHEENDFDSIKDKYDIEHVKVKTISFYKNNQSGQELPINESQLDITPFKDFSNYIDTKVIYYDQQEKQFIYFTNQSLSKKNIFKNEYDLSVFNDQFEPKEIFNKLFSDMKVTYQVKSDENNGKKKYHFYLSQCTQEQIKKYFRDTLNLLNKINNSVKSFYANKKINNIDITSKVQSLCDKYSNDTIDNIQSIDQLTRENLDTNIEKCLEFRANLLEQIENVKNNIPSSIDVCANRVTEKTYKLNDSLMEIEKDIKNFEFATHDKCLDKDKSDKAQIDNEDENKSEYSDNTQADSDDDLSTDTTVNTSNQANDIDELSNPYSNRTKAFVTQLIIFSALFLCTFLGHVFYNQYLNFNKEENYNEEIHNPEQ